ncbi:MAG: tRNA guanosine(15) transglycosylase TgtA [Promethearchaeota archaeon]
MFEIISKDALGRLGKLEINGKKLLTPNIFPVVHPKRQVISLKEMKDDFKVGAVFTNAYLIYQDDSIRDDVRERGIHDFLGFPGIIATDSGAFQHYMYGTDALRAEDIEKFQEDIGSDLAVILDQPVQVTDDRDTALKKVETTIMRAKDNISRRSSQNTSWYGPIHGSMHDDLIKHGAEEMSHLNFSVHALGGVVKLLNLYQFSQVARIVLTAKKYLDPSKPVHLFGAGHPMMFSLYVALGCDLFDSAAYTLFAKEGRYLLPTGTLSLNDMTEFPCNCPVCSKNTPAGIRAQDKSVQHEFLAKHNLYITMSELKVIREHLRHQSLWQLVEMRCRNHPNLLNALRYILTRNNEIWREEPVYKSKAIFYTGPETLKRPEIQAYHEYIQTEYTFPRSAKMVIFFPELDVSPISSPQFNEWNNVLDSISLHVPRENIIVMTVNPIFGLIPEDLSQMYPLSHNLYPMLLDKEQESFLSSFIAKFLDRGFFKGKMLTCLIPKVFRTEYGTTVPFPSRDLLTRIFAREKRSKGLNIKIISTTEELIEMLDDTRVDGVL